MTDFSGELPFLSVIIPAYNRFSYLEEVVESIHKHADYPFELIIHDDNSKDDTKEKLSTLNDRVSTTIMNHGLNMGLAESINRMVAVAGSNYILMLNADCRVDQPIFKDTVNVLGCPFIGTLFYTSLYVAPPKVYANNGTLFSLARGIGAGCVQAFRKDLWASLSGWDNRFVSSGNADVSFMIRILKSGYFTAMLVKDKNEPLVTNMSIQRANGTDSTIPEYYDCSYPKLFHYASYPETCRRRHEHATDSMQVSYRADGGYTNLDYWHKFCCRLMDEGLNVDWKVAKEYGHIRWKEELEKRIVN